VFEVFLWPDERDSIYFEYEISPLNRELPILVPNLGGTFLGWRPWHYEGARKIRKATAAIGGQLASGGKVDGWKADVFISYELLSHFAMFLPRQGRAGVRTSTGWITTTARPQAGIGPELDPASMNSRKFGTLVFE
jgi:hypothetical protein